MVVGTGVGTGGIGGMTASDVVVIK